MLKKVRIECRKQSLNAVRKGLERLGFKETGEFLFPATVVLSGTLEHTALVAAGKIAGVVSVEEKPLRP